MTLLRELFDVDQPVALVTGAGKQRLGQSVARLLHQSGCRIALHANRSFEQAQNVAQAWSSGGAEVQAFNADLKQASQIDTLIEQVLELWERIDILVHCAAIWFPQKLEEIQAEDLDHFYTVNQKASFLLAQKVGLQMASQDQGGAIILMGDWADARPYLDHASYFMSKGAIPMMTRLFAVELASRNSRVRVNAILPGPVTLPTTLNNNQYQHALAVTLCQSEGSPQDIAEATLSLIQNRFVTGTCLPVDGGRTIHSPMDDYKQLP